MSRCSSWTYPRKFEQFLENSQPTLTAFILKKFLPCSCNLDPHLIKQIKDSVEAVDHHRFFNTTNNTTTNLIHLDSSLNNSVSFMGHFKSSCSSSSSSSKSSIRPGGVEVKTQLHIPFYTNPSYLYSNQELLLNSYNPKRSKNFPAAFLNNENNKTKVAGLKA